MAKEHEQVGARENLAVRQAREAHVALDGHEVADVERQVLAEHLEDIPLGRAELDDDFPRADGDGLVHRAASLIDAQAEPAADARAAAGGGDVAREHAGDAR